MRLLLTVMVLLLTPNQSRSDWKASAVSLARGTTEVTLAAAQEEALAERLLTYFQACHPYGQVVGGDDLPHEVLEKLWAEQESIVHATVQIEFGPEAPPHLRGKTFEVLFGFPAENDGLGPVMSRQPNRLLTSYQKCPGLEGLLAACHARRLVPGAEPSQRCREFEALRDTQF